MKWIYNDKAINSKCSIDFLNVEEAQRARNFHQSFPEYAPTPLLALDALAADLGVEKIFIKDESYRFGLNAFKALGGAYAIGRCLADRLHIATEDLSVDQLTTSEAREILGDITIVTATDGNHGRGVAWTANKLKQKSVVYMPKGTSPERLNNILSQGAEASITLLNYDDAVRLASENAKKNGWLLVQDTAWEGYVDIPKKIMQGYMTMALEAFEQLKKMKERPTHIFIQAGVGSLAAAVQAFFANAYGEDCPIVVIVESSMADCLYRTALANNGELQMVSGEMNTIMAGLACGEPSILAWPILKDYSDAFISCQDYVAAQGMRILASPLGNDCAVVAGESGAAGIGAASEILRREKYQGLKEKLRLDEHSKILFFNTEGDTDQDNYKKIVWDGAYSAPEKD
ncbi:MAG: diaminopropionate ammonia-lyase [Clostridia bacterium]|nr:diaminopropionate ammonia-lyase [Clostridia bacterium]